MNPPPDAIEWARIALERARAAWLRLRGCGIGPKVRCGARTRIDRPRGVQIGARAQLEADVWLKLVGDGARLSLGAYTFLGRGVEIDVSESVTIGEKVLLAPGVFVTDHGHGLTSETTPYEARPVARPVVIEDGAWLGVRSIVLPGVRVGKGAVVGAGAVVTKDVPPGAVVAGVPARVVRQRA